MDLKDIYKYNNEWVRLAYSYLNNKEDSEDLVQDVYLKIHNKIQNGKINTMNKCFVYKAIRNSCLDQIRKKKPYFDIEEINIKIKDEINDYYFDDDDFNFLKIINDLPKHQKEFLEESYDTSIRKIANMFNVNYGYVFRELKKAKEKITNN